MDSNSSKETPHEEKFVNIHEVLQDSILESKNEAVEWSVQTFRIPAPLKQLTEEICRSNGTDPSKFLRKCCEALVRDYLPVKPE